MNFAGHAAADAELKHVGPSNTPICEIRIALKTGWGDHESAAWTKLVIFGKPAEWMAGAKKGDTIVANNVEYNVDEWTGKDDQKRQTHYFKAGNGSTCFYVLKGHFCAAERHHKTSAGNDGGG